MSSAICNILITGVLLYTLVLSLVFVYIAMKDAGVRTDLCNRCPLFRLIRKLKKRKDV